MSAAKHPLRRFGLVVAALTLAACSSGQVTTPGPTGTPIVQATTEPTEIPPAPSPSLAAPDLRLVAVGDSIGFNSPDDCSGCTGFVAQYADAAAAAIGKTLLAQNLTEHNGLTVDRLLIALESNQTRIDALANADIIILNIAHNDVPMNRDDDSCDGMFSETPDWSRFTDACLATELARFKPTYEGVYAKVAALRADKPTILRTINRYNDWIGWPGHVVTAAGVKTTAKVIAAWNEMLCAAAEANGFLCADISSAFNGATGTKPSGDLLGLDYTHPSQKGNDAIEQVLLNLGFLPLGPETSP